MDITQKLQHKVSHLSPFLAQEVFDFIGYLEHIHQRDQEFSLLKHAQQASMCKVWDNPTDEVWNDL
ncbi:MAG: hypothetical protein HQL84_05930 [Magnetococcales bacterium]|nr:hypothetical protein [Magnetococcales bacterium]MBF0149570.1 hypothetical protein [Magnetococcales bacterium]